MWAKLFALVLQNKYLERKFYILRLSWAPQQENFAEKFTFWVMKSWEKIPKHDKIFVVFKQDVNRSHYPRKCSYNLEVSSDDDKRGKTQWTQMWHQWEWGWWEAKKSVNFSQTQMTHTKKASGKCWYHFKTILGRGRATSEIRELNISIFRFSSALSEWSEYLVLIIRTEKCFYHFCRFAVTFHTRVALPSSLCGEEQLRIDIHFFPTNSHSDCWWRFHFYSHNLEIHIS